MTISPELYILLTAAILLTAGALWYATASKPVRGSAEKDKNQKPPARKSGSSEKTPLSPDSLTEEEREEMLRSMKAHARENPEQVAKHVRSMMDR